MARDEFVHAGQRCIEMRKTPFVFDGGQLQRRHFANAGHAIVQTVQSIRHLSDRRLGAGAFEEEVWLGCGVLRQRQCVITDRRLNPVQLELAAGADDERFQVLRLDGEKYLHHVERIRRLSRIAEHAGPRELDERILRLLPGSDRKIDERRFELRMLAVKLGALPAERGVLRLRGDLPGQVLDSHIQITVGTKVARAQPEREQQQQPNREPEKKRRAAVAHDEVACGEVTQEPPDCKRELAKALKEELRGGGAADTFYRS